MRKQKLTQKEAARLIRNCGRTLVVRDGEFIVKLHGKGLMDKSTYITDDLEDAVHTARSAWLTEQTAAQLATPPLPKDAELLAVVADDTVVKIEYWWDRFSRNWIIQAKDKDDNQIGEATYAANKGTLDGALENVKEQYPNVPCGKWEDEFDQAFARVKS